MAGSFIGGLVGGAGGGAIGSAVVNLSLDTSRYGAQLAAAEGETAAAVGGMGAETKAASSTMASAYAAAGIAAGAFALSAIQSASEHEQVMAALTQQVGENTGAFEAQATALQNLTGFQDEAILGADTILARFKLTDEQVRASIPTILDYARATGKDVPESATAIGRALLGNARALKTIGISYTATGDTATDFANVLDLVNQKVGGQAAAYADTYAGKLEILSAKFDDLKEAVGAPLIGALSDVAETLGQLDDIIVKVSGDVPGFGSAFHDLLPIFDPLVGLWDYSAKAIDVLHGAIVGDTEATDELTLAALAVGDATKGVADAADIATAASKAHAQALRDEHAAEQELAGGLTGLIADMNRLNDAQHTVNTLRRQGKQHTQEYRDAELAAIEAQRTFNGDLAEQAQKMRDNDVPLRNIIDRVFGIGKQAGLTRKEIRDLIDETNGFSDALDKLNNRTVHVKVEVDTRVAEATIAGLEARLNRVGT